MPLGFVVGTPYSVQITDTGHVASIRRSELPLMSNGYASSFAAGHDLMTGTSVDEFILDLRIGQSASLAQRINIKFRDPMRRTVSSLQLHLHTE